MITEFRNDQTASTPNKETSPSATRSVERYLSSLRKYFSYLVTVDVLQTNPFDELKALAATKEKADPWEITAFKNMLYEAKASDLTIKNYIIDIQQFITWMTAAIGTGDQFEIHEHNIPSYITPSVLEEYKSRLLHEAKASPKTVNRKLSSLRKYILWAQKRNMIPEFAPEQLPKNTGERVATGVVVAESEDTYQSEAPIAITEPEAVIETGQDEPEEISASIKEEFMKPSSYSRIPPVRLLQKVRKGGMFLFDIVVVLPLVTGMEVINYRIWLLKGSPVFVPQARPSLSKRAKQLILKHNLLPRRVTPSKPKVIASIPKSFYAPMAISLRHAPLHKKALFHLKHTRPKWYRSYHSYGIVHYAHAAILVIIMSAAGFGVVQAMSDSGQTPVAVASLPAGPPRLVAFKGRLITSETSPITANTNLRFGIYKDAKASGSALLWEEVREVTPDETGAFSLMLGEVREIPQRLFTDNPRLYIGMTVGTEQELTPRKQIPTAVLASTADTLQGLRPITDPQAGEKNAVLALDSSGNMVIGGNANPVFIATGGSFTLAGQTLILTTAPGTDSDIVIAPDGFGKVDIQRPIHNTSEQISPSGITGAVEIADNLVITASQSAQSALYINQNSNGPLISASSSGIAKFTLEHTGAASFGDSLMIHGDTLSTTQTSFSLLTTNPINLNFGTSATSLSIGGTEGTTTINNSRTIISGNLDVNGTTGLTFGNSSAGITFSGGGTHLIKASSGDLKLGEVTLTGTTKLAKDQSILPESADGINNLGSQSNPFDTLYVENIASPALLWQTSGTAITPKHAESIALGTNTAAPVWQVFASGAKAGTASSSGSLSFTGSNTTIDTLHGGSLTFRMSPGGDDGLSPIMTLSADRVDIVGTVTATDLIETSSRRYKKDIVPVHDPLGTIGKLQGVYYTWDEDHGGRRALGFIAEEVGAVIPEVVHWEEDGVHARGISYGDLTALAIEGIKAQQKQISVLSGMVHAITLTEDTQLHVMVNGTDVTVQDETGTPVTAKGGFAEAVIGKITAGMQQVHHLTTGTMQAGQSILGIASADSLTTEYLAVGDMQVAGTLGATQATILSLRTESLQATEGDSLTLSLGSSAIRILTGSQGVQIAVTEFDSYGNASFTGAIRAEQVVAATSVTAKKIIADELNLSDEGLRSLAQHIAGYLPQSSQNTSENIHLSLTTTDLPGENEADSASESGVLTGETDDSASSSAGLTDHPIVSDYSPLPPSLPNYNSIGETLIGSSMPTGAGYVVSDLSVADTLIVSGNFIMNNNSINVIGADLEIQPLQAGGVSFMAGLVTISPDGNLTVNGNAFFAGDMTVNGQLQAGIISPVGEQDLIVKLGTEQASGDQSLVIQNATGASQLRINDTGDIESEGTGSFTSLLSKSLNIARGAQADDSPVRTIASSSAGTAVILPGQTYRTIVTPFVNAESLVYMTPTSDTQGVVPYIARQTAEDPMRGRKGSFTIEISNPVTKPIKVNWWVVN